MADEIAAMSQGADPYASIRYMDFHQNFDEQWVRTDSEGDGYWAKAGGDWGFGKSSSLEDAQAFEDWLKGTGFQSKYNRIHDYGDGRLGVSLQRPGMHKYDTMEAIYAKDSSGRWVLQNDPQTRPGREVSTLETQWRDTAEDALTFVAAAAALYAGGTALSGALGGAGAGGAAAGEAGAAGAGAGAGSTAASGATNAALIDSAAGTAGYGASSAGAGGGATASWGAGAGYTADALGGAEAGGALETGGSSAGSEFNENGFNGREPTNPSFVQSGNGYGGYTSSGTQTGGGYNWDQLIRGGLGLWQAYRMDRNSRDGGTSPASRAANAELTRLLENPSGITEYPGYQAGIQAVERAGAGGGYLGSGNMMHALHQYGGEFYDRALTRLAGIAVPGEANALQAQMASTQLYGEALNSLGYGFSGNNGGGTNYYDALIQLLGE